MAAGKRNCVQGQKELTLSEWTPRVSKATAATSSCRLARLLRITPGSTSKLPLPNLTSRNPTTAMACVRSVGGVVAVVVFALSSAASARMFSPAWDTTLQPKMSCVMVQRCKDSQSQ